MLLAEFSPCLRLWIVAITHCEFGLLMRPSLGLQLSCFGHDSAKNNSMSPCGRELCSTFVWNYPRLSFPSLQGFEGIVLL